MDSKLKHNEKWYQIRLAKYFYEKYGRFEDDAEFMQDPCINTWIFLIPYCDDDQDLTDEFLKVELTCDDDGNVYDQFLIVRS